MAYPTEHLSPAERALHADLALLASACYQLAAEMVIDSRTGAIIYRLEHHADNMKAVVRQIEEHVRVCLREAQIADNAIAEAAAKNKLRQARKINAA